MAKIVGNPIGKQVCEALGLDASKVRTIDLHIQANEFVTATVMHYVTSEQMDSLLKVLSAYTLRHENYIEQAEAKPGEDITPLGEGDELMRFFKGGS